MTASVGLYSGGNRNRLTKPNIDGNATKAVAQNLA